MPWLGDNVIVINCVLVRRTVHELGDSEKGVSNEAKVNRVSYDEYKRASSSTHTNIYLVFLEVPESDPSHVLLFFDSCHLKLHVLTKLLFKLDLLHLMPFFSVLFLFNIVKALVNSLLITNVLIVQNVFELLVTLKICVLLDVVESFVLTSTF